MLFNSSRVMGVIRRQALYILYQYTNNSTIFHVCHFKAFWILKCFQKSYFSNVSYNSPAKSSCANLGVTESFEEFSRCYFIFDRLKG